MKLGEARQRLAALEEALDRLEARLAHDVGEGLPVTPVVQELVLTTQKMRDLRIAISWSESICKIADESLSSYIVKRDSLRRLAETLDKPKHSDLRARADELFTSAQSLQQVITMAEWEVDLQVPAFLVPAQGE